MKKKLLLLALAAALPLAACGKDNKDDDTTPGGPNAQEIQALALTESYVDFAKLTMGEQQGTMMRSFLSSGAEVVSPYEVDIEKVYTHILSIGETAFSASDELEAVMSIAGEISQMKTEGLIDDTVYYFLGFGDGMLKAASQMSGSADPAVLATLSKIDSEVENIANNVCGVINSVLNVYAEVTSPTFLPTIMSAVDLSTYEVKADGLKAAITAITSVFGKLNMAKANLEYLADLVLPVVNVIVPNVPEEVNIVFNHVKVSDVVGVAFDGITFVLNSLNSLSDDYYEHLADIENPIENIAYAVLGIAEHTRLLIYQGTPEAKVSAAIDKILEIGLGIATDMLAKYQVTLPDDVATMLASDKPKALLMASAKLCLDVLGLNYDTLSAESLAKLMPLVVNLFLETTTEAQQNNFATIRSLVNPVFEILCELADEKEQLSKILDDVFNMFNCGYDVFLDIVDVVAPNMDITTALIIGLVATMLDEEDGCRSELKSVLFDLVDIVKDLFGSFVTTDQLAADLDIVAFINSITSGNFGMEQLLALKLDESRLDHVDDLCRHVYILLDTLEIAEDVIGFILEEMGVTGVEIKDKDSFVDFFYGVVKSILVDGVMPEALLGEVPPQE